MNVGSLYFIPTLTRIFCCYCVNYCLVSLLF
nr:MAG TPA: hypothetical protein [Bacteriophage sp.]